MPKGSALLRKAERPPNGFCFCGCGGETKDERHFISGHDPKFKEDFLNDPGTTPVLQAFVDARQAAQVAP